MTTKKSAAKDRISQDDPLPDGQTPHLLFLPETPDDPLIFPMWISIARIKPFPDSSAGVVEASELPDIEAIVSRYGAGTYRVQARDARKCVMAMRVIGPLRGPKPRQMYTPPEGTDYEDEDAAEERATSAAATAPAQANPMQGLVEFLSSMQMQQQQFLATMQLESAKARATDQARVDAMAERERDRADKSQERMFSLMADAIKVKTEAPIQLAKDQLAASADKDTPMDIFMQGVEFANGVREASGAGNEADDTAKLIEAGVKAFMQVKGISLPEIPSS